MKNRRLCLALCVSAMLVSGCATRSISDSSYREPWRGDSRFEAELSELNVLGIVTDAANAAPDDGDIANALTREPLKLKRGSRVLLIQSGAMFPDEPMQRALGACFSATPFSGIVDKKSDLNYNRAFRMAAAQGGYDYVLCYWGVLESADRKLATKTVSWAPVVGRLVPDQTQQVRIRLKLLAIETKTGRWLMVAPDPIEGDAISAKLTREQSDQGLVANLKERGYAALVEELAAKHME